MFSLRDFAAHSLPEGNVLPEVVARDILSQTLREIHAIDKQIGKEDGKYQKMFHTYTNVLDPLHDFTRQYARKKGEENLYDIMRRLSVDFKHLYYELPENYDEGTPWFAYFEYMFFRAFPDDSIIWDFNHGRAQADNKRLIVTIRGLYQIISEVPRPDERIPPELVAMDRIFSKYSEHLKNLNEIIKTRFSYSNVFKLQKKYVRVYEERYRIKRILQKTKEFYVKIRKKMYSSVFVPKVLQ